MSPLAHPKGKTPSRSSNLRKGVLLRLPACQSLSLWERWHCEAMTERASPAGKSRCAAMGRLFVRAMLSLCQSCLSAALPSQSGLRPPAPPKGEPLACRSGSPSSNLSVSLRSTAPLVGEPLAERKTLNWEGKLCGMPKPPLGRGGGSASALTERLSSSPRGGAIGRPGNFPLSRLRRA